MRNLRTFSLQVKKRYCWFQKGTKNIKYFTKRVRMKSEKWKKRVCVHDWKYFWHVLFMPPNNVSHDLQQVKVTMFKEKNQQHFILCKMKIYKSKQNSCLQKHLREEANSHKEEFSQGCLDYKAQIIAQIKGKKDAAGLPCFPL